MAHLSWATWSIQSQSLISSERPERFAHGHSFVLSDLRESLSVAHLILAKWVNEQMSDERMSEFPALLPNKKRFWISEPYIWNRRNRALCRSVWIIPEVILDPLKLQKEKKINLKIIMRNRLRLPWCSEKHASVLFDTLKGTVKPDFWLLVF